MNSTPGPMQIAGRVTRSFPESTPGHPGGKVPTGVPRARFRTRRQADAAERSRKNAPFTLE